ncbi:hypothetical protein NE237_019845 [Protea cynaroides]|uniref:Uncharacterized protein n=1 Tax=Protea cynaroides TaxID=273540 RepID=A0A9Q0H8A8_9MAGN|nr:hypothetical protein NE237_019845 [Protea cynaroides]
MKYKYSVKYGSSKIRASIELVGIGDLKGRTKRPVMQYLEGTHLQKQVPGFEIFHDCTLDWEELEQVKIQEQSKKQKSETEVINISKLFDDDQVMTLTGEDQDRSPDVQQFTLPIKGIIPNWSCHDNFVYPKGLPCNPHIMTMSEPRVPRSLDKIESVSKFESVPLGTISSVPRF